MALAAQSLDAMGTKVDAMHRVLLGNGDVKHGLAYRMERIEANGLTTATKEKTNSERIWRIVEGVVILAVGAGLALFATHLRGG